MASASYCSPFRVSAAAISIFALSSTPLLATTIEEGFETGLPSIPGTTAGSQILSLGSGDWYALNLSDAPNHGVFAGASTGDLPAFAGADFAAFDYESTSGVGTISLWLISPELSVGAGDTITFWTLSAGNGYADRLEVRFSDAGASLDVGTGSSDTGDFDLVLGSVNSDLLPAGYPTAYTQYSFSVPSAATGRFAFRYYVTNGGPDGANGNMVGIDSVVITTTPVPEPSVASLLAALAALGFAASRRFPHRA